jgi:uncharacterized protein
MKCPKCNITLLMSDKQGIEIDYCPDCRGIWLDRGELEKIIERSTSPEYDQNNYYPGSKADRSGYYERDHNDSHDYKHGKRRNLFSELFD